MTEKVKWAFSRILAFAAAALALALPTHASARPAPSAESQPNGQLKAFLLELMHDPAKLVAFRENPDAVLGETGLSPEEKDVLRSGNQERIHMLLAQGFPKPLPPIVIRPTISPDTPPRPTVPGTTSAPKPSTTPNPN